MARPEPTELIQALIGCSWGRKVGADDDLEPCPDQAVRLAVLYDEGKAVEVRLCPKHMSRIMEDSEPHEDGTP